MISKTAKYWILPTSEELIGCLRKLRDAGFQEDEVVILAKSDRQVSWLQENTSLQIQTENHSFWGSAASFFRGEDRVQDVLFRLGLESEVVEEVTREIDAGHYFIFADSVHGANLGATDDSIRHIVDAPFTGEEKREHKNKQDDVKGGYENDSI